MKKIMKLKKISQKSKKYASKKKFYRNHLLQKKIFLKQIESPHNTNEFLMNNQSSPFFPEDAEDSSIIEPCYIIPIEDDTNSEIDLFSIKDLTFLIMSTKYPLKLSLAHSIQWSIEVG